MIHSNLWCAFAVMIVWLCPCPAFSAQQKPERPSLAESVRLKLAIEQTRLQAARNKVEQSRLDLYQEIIELRERDKREAQKQLAENQSTRRKNEAVLERKVAQLERIRKKKELKNRQIQIASEEFGFQTDSKQSLDLKDLGRRFNFLNKRRMEQVKLLVTRPEFDAGKINSGKGLNILLAQLGSVAYDHEYQLSHLDGEIDSLKKEIELVGPGEVIPGEGMSELQQQLYAKKEAKKILLSIRGRAQLTDRELKSLKLTRINGKNILSVFPDDEPCKINWYLFDKLVGFEFKDSRRSIERLTAKALKELSYGNGMTAATHKSLATALKNFKDDLKEFEKKPSKAPDLEFESKLWRGPIRQELIKITRNFDALMLAESIDDLRASEVYSSGKTVNELLAYMHRNGLQFYYNSSGDESTKSAHAKIFREMVSFYTGVKQLEAAMDTDNSANLAQQQKLENAVKQDNQRLKRMDESLLEIKYDSYFKPTTTNFDNLDGNKPSLGDKVFETIGDQLIRSGVDALFRRLVE